MPHVEIYTCYEGQDLKQGELDTSQEINSRNDAEGDARYRCSEDNGIQRIAYYTVMDDGDTKKLLVYENPHFSPSQSPVAAAKTAHRELASGTGNNGGGNGGARKAGKARPKQKGNWLVNRLLDLVTEEVPR